MYELPSDSYNLENDLIILGRILCDLSKYLTELGMEWFQQGIGFRFFRDSLLKLNKKLESDRFMIRNYGQEEELIKKLRNLSYLQSKLLLIKILITLNHSQVRGDLLS